MLPLEVVVEVEEPLSAAPAVASDPSCPAGDFAGSKLPAGSEPIQSHFSST